MSNFLKSLVQFIKPFMRFTVILYFKLNIRLIHFFIDTKIGYGFYLFCVLYGFFGCNDTQNPPCHVSNTLAAFFVLFIIGTVVELWFFVKIPFTRKILDDLLTKEYILKYLGEHTLSKTAFKTLGTLIGVAFIDAGTEHLGHIQNTLNADKVTDEYYKSIEQAKLKHDPNSRTYKDALSERNYHLHKKTEGLISKSINNDTIRHGWSELSKAIGGFGKT